MPWTMYAQGRPPSGGMDSSNHATGGANGSIIMVVMFVVCVCCEMRSLLVFITCK